MRAFAIASLLGAALLALLLWTYGGSLGLFFSDIDDATILRAAVNRVSATPQFRPLFALWNQLLLALFGPEPAGWRALDLALHFASSLLVARLVRDLGASRGAAWIAAFVFATFYSGHEAVLWISANCGLLSVFFVLIAACAWSRHVTAGGLGALAVALLGVLGAMGSKQDCVVLAPLLIGIEACRCGVRRLVTARSLARYALLAALGIGWLAIAMRPDVWAQEATVGRYVLDARSLPELVGHLGLLFSIGRVEARALSAGAIAAGVAVLLVHGGLARASPRRRGVVVTGLLVVVVSILPVLPGSVTVAGTRYAYPAGIGVALVVAALYDEVVERAAASRAPRVVRTVASVAIVAWIGVQTIAIRSIGSWRFAAAASRFEALIGSTRSHGEVLAPGERAFVLAPPVWNVTDYVHGIDLLAGPPLRAVEVAWLDVAELEASFVGGGRFDRGAHPVLLANEAGRLERIGPEQALPTAALSRRVAAYAAGSPTGRVPVVAMERLREPAAVGSTRVDR